MDIKEAEDYMEKDRDLLEDLFYVVDGFMKNHNTYSKVERVYTELVKHRNPEELKKPMYTFEQYCDDVGASFNKHPKWRAGQAYSNVLADKRPDLSERIRGGRIDPFYDTTILPRFLLWVSKNWIVDDALA